MVQVLWEQVFSMFGLLESIVGDCDTRLHALQMRALCAGLQVRMKLSVAYHPQTDGATKVVLKAFINGLRSFVNHYHTNWVECIPAFRNAYHNTVHSSTGFMPHMLRMGWSPRDLRAPMATTTTSKDPSVDAWLERRSEEFQRPHVSLERARSAVIAAQKASARSHTYKPGDAVKISTRVLPVKAGSPQTPAPVDRPLLCH